ncbi:response regulator [Candidatus Neomarinimicrobiota bacterium]
MPRILIADNHSLFREGLALILKSTFETAIIDEACSGQEALDKIWDNQYDVVLLDISIPGRDGLSVLNQLKREKSTIPILVLSDHPEEQYAVRSLKSGAAGYLTKACGKDAFVEAIQKVRKGENYITPSLAQTLAKYIGKDMDEFPHESLTDREFEIFRHIISGSHLNLIAENLSLSAKTISAHRAHILKKMNMNSNAELVRYANEEGLFD